MKVSEKIFQFLNVFLSVLAYGRIGTALGIESKVATKIILRRHTETSFGFSERPKTATNMGPTEN